MRNLLAGLAAVVLIVAGVGWYLGWYHVQSTPTSDGQQEIKINVDRKKITGDVSKGVQEGTQKVESWLHQKDGHSHTSTPPPVEHNSSPPPSTSQARFIVNQDGTLTYTGEISTPLPINSK